MLQFPIDAAPVSLETIPAIFTKVIEDLNLRLAVLPIQLVVRAVIEPEISDSKSGVLTTGHAADLKC